MPDTPEKKDTPEASKTTQNSGTNNAQSMSDQIESERERRGLPSGQFGKLRKGVKKAQKLREQQELSYAAPRNIKEIPSILGARLKERAERSLLSPLGNLGEAIYQSRRMNPGQKMSMFKSVLMGSFASNLGRFGIVGDALANQIRTNQTFINDPETQVIRMQEQFGTVVKAFKTYDENFDKLGKQQKELSLSIQKLEQKSASSNIEETVKGFTNQVQGIEGRIDKTTSEVQRLSEDVLSMNSGIDELTKRVNSTINSIDNIDDKIGNISSDLAEIQNRLAATENITKNQDIGINDLIETQDRHGKYIDGIVDDYNKQFKQIDERLEKIENKARLNSDEDEPPPPRPKNKRRSSWGKVIDIARGKKSPAGQMAAKTAAPAAAAGGGGLLGTALSILPFGKAAKGVAALGAAGLFMGMSAYAARGQNNSAQQKDDNGVFGLGGFPQTDKTDKGGAAGLGGFPQTDKTDKGGRFGLGGFPKTTKGKPISATADLDRRDVEKEKSQFLQFGQLPKGFEFLPGHMGRLGSAAAVAATGAVPLGDIGGGAGTRESGPQGVSNASREALGYSTGREAQTGRETVYGAPLQPSTGGEQFGSAIPAHMRGRMAEGVATPEGKKIDRSRFDAEMKNPEVRAAIAARAELEVGSQKDPQKWVESMMNRAAARNKSLMDAVNNSDGYYPKSDNAKFHALRKQEPVLKKWDGLMDHVHKDGPNTARGATGNESGSVQSGGAPIVASGGGERYVVEKADRKWKPTFVDIDPKQQAERQAQQQGQQAQQYTKQSGESEEPTKIIDKSEQAGFGNRFGTFKDGVKGLIVHHTSGGGTSDGVIKTFQQRNFPAQYIMERDGTIVRALPEGARGQHMRPGQGPGEGLGNQNMEGIEVIAKNNQDWTDAQKKAMVKFTFDHAKKHGYDPQKKVFGHGEVNPHKEADEGMHFLGWFRQNYADLKRQYDEGKLNQSAQQAERQKFFQDHGVADRPISQGKEIKVGEPEPPKPPSQRNLFGGAPQTQEQRDKAKEATAKAEGGEFTDYSEYRSWLAGRKDFDYERATAPKDQTSQGVAAVSSEIPQEIPDLPAVRQNETPAENTPPERVPVEPEVAVPTPALEMPKQAPMVNGLQTSDVEPMAPGDVKEKGLTAADIEPMAPGDVKSQGSSSSGGAEGGQGGGNAGGGSPNLRNNFENRAPSPGDGGYGNHMRCFV